MSFDFRIRNYCDHIVYRELVELEDDQLTLVIPRPIANKSSVELYIDDTLILENDPVFGHRIQRQEFYSFSEEQGAEIFRAQDGIVVTAFRQNIQADTISYFLNDDRSVSVSSTNFTVISSPEGFTFFEPSSNFDSSLEGEHIYITYTFDVESPESTSSALHEIIFDRFVLADNHVIELTYPTTVTNCRKCNAFGYLNDIAINSVGEIETVVDTEKLLQDAFIWTFTEVRSDPFYAYIGTVITRIVGQPYVQNQTELDISTTVRDSLTFLQELQGLQSRVQEVTPQETLIRIESINLQRDNEDPTVFRLSVVVNSQLDQGQEIDTLLRFSQVA